jgi:nicotinate-nucleotide adenylyltransferase
MNLGFFGGTFDPIHLGHVALARAAQERFALHQVHFVPANVPPHRPPTAASFAQRYAMIALATREEKTFVPSLLEAPREELPDEKSGKAKPQANYTIDTIRRWKKSLNKSDRIFLLIGIDAFRDIAKWREAEALLRECTFIVASRPGYSLADVATALPEGLRPKAAVTKPFAKHPATGDLVLPGVTIHLLDGVQQLASSTTIRSALAGKKGTGGLLDPAVAGYIRKVGLYKSSR